MPRIRALLTNTGSVINHGVLISSFLGVMLTFANVELSDLENYLLLELPATVTTASRHELIATEALQFCRFPNSSYVYNDYAQVPRQQIPATVAQELIQHGQKLTIFCIAHAQDAPATICGIELAHLMRIQCAYVFRGLPQAEHVQAYLVPVAAVARVLRPATRVPEAEIETDQLDQAGEDLGLDWSALAHDLNAEPLQPTPEERYRITLWFLKLKNYVLQKAVAVLMYLLERPK